MEFIRYNAPSSIVFYLEMKVEVEVSVHDIRSRFSPRVIIKYFDRQIFLINFMSTWIYPAIIIFTKIHFALPKR